mmetsp:Transcript_25446/g.28463  ORF Transcript_25446/g.28463 Transcript_25446/m.28463 type:complete len:96 (-) Transcript_25446:61-348(-)
MNKAKSTTSDKSKSINRSIQPSSRIIVMKDVDWEDSLTLLVSIPALIPVHDIFDTLPFFMANPYFVLIPACKFLSSMLSTTQVLKSPRSTGETMA